MQIQPRQVRWKNRKTSKRQVNKNCLTTLTGLPCWYWIDRSIWRLCLRIATRMGACSSSFKILNSWLQRRSKSLKLRLANRCSWPRKTKHGRTTNFTTAGKQLKTLRMTLGHLSQNRTNSLDSRQRKTSLQTISSKWLGSCLSSLKSSRSTKPIELCFTWSRSTWNNPVETLSSNRKLSQAITLKWLRYPTKTC
jgi:hypothetical protein